MPGDGLSRMGHQRLSFTINPKPQPLTSMSKALPQNTLSTHEQIAATAHTLWEQAGRPRERDLEFWLKAEQQVVAKLREPAGLTGRRNGARLKPAGATRSETAAQAGSIR